MNIPLPEPGGNGLQDLVARYGREMVEEQLRLFVDRLEAIADLNAQLAELSSDGESEEYSGLVQRIITATQEYYQYIGNAPDDVRRVILRLADSGKSGSDADMLDELNINLSIDSSPLLSAQSIRPRSYIMQIDAITSQLASLEGQTQLRVGKKGKQPVLTTVTLDMPDHMRLESGQALTSYDKSIINGVTSLMESGNTVFSIPMLYHAMTGKKNPTVDESLYDELTLKLEKMRRMMLTIDLTEENEARYVTGESGEQMEITDLTLEGYLLPLNKVSGMVNGKRTELYQILQHPPLYTYSKMRRQLASVRISLLGAPVNNNSTTIPLRTYLLQRIELMRNQRNVIYQTTILYESIYEELNAVDVSKTRKKRIRNYTTTILDYFIEQGYISSYVEFKKGRSIAGLQIFL